MKQPILHIIKPKGLFKGFQKDKFILEYEYCKLSGDWDDAIMAGLLMAGDKPIVVEE